MERDLILIGGGGHALVVAEAARLAGFVIAGCLDDRADADLISGPFAAPWLGPLSEISRIEDRAWILAIGDLARRRELLPRLERMAEGAASVVHPGAFVAPSATVGRGVYIGPGAIVHTLARVSGHAIVNSGAIVEHECVVGSNTHVAPGAALGGRVRVGSDTLVGLGARVLPNRSIGSRCTIGAGAVVNADVPDACKIVGVPGRAI